MGNPITPNCLDFLPVLVTTGNNVIFAATNYSYISIQTDSGCTATVTRVDNLVGTTVGGPASTFTVGTSTFKTQAVDWQYYQVAAAGGSLRLCFG